MLVNPEIMQRPAEVRARSGRSARRSTAFTVIELVIVLGILAVLVAITIGVAQRVTASGRAKATELFIQSLDTITDAFFQANKGQLGNMIIVVDDDGGTNPDRYAIPLIDGVPVNAAGVPLATTASGEPVIHVASAAFLELMRQRSTDAAKGIEGLDTTFLKRGEASSISPRYAIFGWRVNNDGQIQGALQRLNLEMRIPVDAWENPLHFVHPDFQGGHGVTFATGTSINRNLIEFPQGGGSAGTFRRSARPSAVETVPGDADEGFTIGARPYWYSAGTDRNPGTIEDNIYTVRPRFERLAN